MSNTYTSTLTKSLRALNWFEILLLIAIFSLSAISFAIKQDFSMNAWIAVFAAILGVFCVVFGAKGSMANWLFGIVETIFSIYICFCTHIYGDMLQRIFYNLPMQFIGWHKWSKRVSDDKACTIKTRYMTWAQRFTLITAVAVMTVLLGIFLKYFGPWMIETLHSVLPDMQFQTLKMDYDTETQLWLDSFTTVLSIVTMYISVKAFVEQWYMWLIINVAYIAMWMMSDSAFSFMIVAKYCVYFVNCFYGIYTWHKLSKAK